MGIALQHSLNALPSHESNAELSALSNGGLEKGNSSVTDITNRADIRENNCYLVKDLKSRKSHHTIFGTDLQLALPMRVLNSVRLLTWF